MLVEFGKANLIDKARLQPDKVKMVLDKIKTEGLSPTLQACFQQVRKAYAAWVLQCGICRGCGQWRY